MLYRNKKENDDNAGKWIGIGGKFLEGESPLSCAKREVYEETGLNPDLVLRAIISFRSDIYQPEDMYLFWGESKTDKVKDCNEGTLKWIPQKDLFTLPMWEGDKIFLQKLFSTEEFFTLTLTYKGDKLESAK